VTQHTCSRCGLESASPHRNWADRHPVAAVLFALPAGFTLVSVILAYPWFAVPLLVVATGLWVDRRNRRRAAFAARADFEYREQLLRELQQAPAGLPAAARQPTRRRPRGADHWSNTEPLCLDQKGAPRAHHEGGKRRASVFAKR
jgi:hypothetical protein